MANLDAWTPTGQAVMPSSVSLLSSAVFGWHGGAQWVFSVLPGRIGVVGSQKKRPVVLTESDREWLVRLTRTGVHPASMIMRARVLVALDTSGGVVDPKEVIAARLGVSGETLPLVAKRFAETGVMCTRRPRVSSGSFRRWPR
jgi:hypothetical protein